MRYRDILLLLALSMASASAAPAQRPTGRALLVGTVRDSATGRAPARSAVCVSLPTLPRTTWRPCADVDTVSGAFRLDSLPPGRWSVEVVCATRDFFAHAMAKDSVAVSETAPARRDWRVTPSGCDPRPLRRISGMFRGYYTPGFESSEFAPCAADAWFLPGDSLRTRPYDERGAWADFEKGVLQGFQWPQAPRDRDGNRRYYVQWRATVEGPGHYGHMGGAPFAIHVDSLAVVRAPEAGDCQPLPSPSS